MSKYARITRWRMPMIAFHARAGVPARVSSDT
jgi:hypothetical protein